MWTQDGRILIKQGYRIREITSLSDLDELQTQADLDQGIPDTPAVAEGT